MEANLIYPNNVPLGSCESCTCRSSTSHARWIHVDRRWDEGMVEGEQFSLWRDDLFLDFSLNFLWLSMNADDLQSQRSLCLSFSLKETIFFLCLRNNYEDLSFFFSPSYFFFQRTNSLLCSSTDPDRDLIPPFQPIPKQFRDLIFTQAWRARRELSNATDRFKIGVQTEEKSKKETWAIGSLHVF